jgi:excisionase family DNA binding protein
MAANTSEDFCDRPRSVEEIAKYLRTSRWYVYTEIARGNLKARQFSRKLIRVMPKDLRRWLNGD